MRQDKHYGSRSSRERKLAKTFVPGSERAEPFRICSRERKFQGAKWPGSELARERMGQGPIGRPRTNGPGSEKARYHTTGYYDTKCLIFAKTGTYYAYFTV